MSKPTSTLLLCAGAIMALTASTGTAQTAANYPTKPVRIVLPYAAGGSASVLAQAFANSMGQDLGKNFIVDNRPGGGSLIGTEMVAHAAPDGHTLLTISTTVVINPWTHSNLSFDTAKAFTPISTLVRQTQMLVVHPSVPANNFKELIAYMKQYPGKLNAYSSGPGNSGHLTNLLFMKATGIKYTMVPYKGGGSVINDILSGDLQLAINTPTLFAPHVKSGKLRAIATSSERRIAVLPDLPTFIESGLNFTSGNWYMLLAPSKTPKDIIEKLHASTARAQASTDVQEALTKQGIATLPNTLAATNAFFRSELKRYGDLVKENNIKAADD